MSEREEFWKVTPDTVAGKVPKSTTFKKVRKKVRVCPTHRDWERYSRYTDGKFCRLCGEKTIEEEQEVFTYHFYAGDIPYRYCKRCNNVFPSIATQGGYCGNCGVKLSPELIGRGGTD